MRGLAAKLSGSSVPIRKLEVYPQDRVLRGGTYYVSFKVLNNFLNGGRIQSKDTLATIEGSLFNKLVGRETELNEYKEICGF